MVIASDLTAVRDVSENVLKTLDVHGYSKESVFAIRLAVEEGLNNAIKHGNQCDCDKNVQVSYDVDSKRAVITITDQGCGFNSTNVPDPTTDENLEKPHGRGIMLMRAYMDEVHFNKCGNQVRMVKKNQ